MLFYRIWIEDLQSNPNKEKRGSEKTQDSAV